MQTDTFSKIPAFPIPEGFSDDYTYLESLVRKGAKERWPTGISGDVARRIAYELRAIKSAGAAGYFLIVHDYVTAARAMGVRVGPGREGGGGSVVAYCLKITSVDPAAFGMLSELFISPLKRTIPDLNVDFADSDLDRIRALLVAKYGYRHVARISIPGYDVNGTERGRALHACALLISRDDLVKSFPVALTKNEKMLMVPAALPALRSCGYRIFNLMGFRVLTEMERMLAQIRREHGVELNPEALPLDDKETYKLFATGATDSIYQFNAAAMQEWLREVQPSCFEELTAVYALSSPQFAQLHRRQFLARKSGREAIDYLHPLLVESLGVTYGLCLYQEQLLQLIQHLTRMSPFNAEIIRNALCNKPSRPLTKLKEGFVKCCLLNPDFRSYEPCVDERGATETAEKIWSGLRETSQSAVSKSHHACYTLLAYQMGYLRLRLKNYGVE